MVWSTCWVKGGLYDDPSKVKCFGSRVLGGRAFELPLT